MPFQVDIEPTNRCNASCTFCPRDATPHEGVMTEEIFDKALSRVLEFADIARQRLGEKTRVSLCGLGEPLINKHTPEWAARITDAGLGCIVSSNGFLLDERRGQALLDAKVRAVHLNAGELYDDYERIYKLPFERTRENIVRFIEMCEGTSCAPVMVVVDHRGEIRHTRQVKRFWRKQGARRFMQFSLINRGGALFVDSMQFERSGSLAGAMQLLDITGEGAKPICSVPFSYPFIGYDGQYYLCCSDWRRQAPMGGVFDKSITDVMEAKLAHVTSRQPVCVTCNHDPTNHLADEMDHLGADHPDIAPLAEQITAHSIEWRATVRQLATMEAADHRTRIPVIAL